MIAPEVVDSPWLGMIPITKISGGAKQLIMAKAVKGIVLTVIILVITAFRYC